MPAIATDAISPAPLLERVAAELQQCRAILGRIEHSFHEALGEGSASPKNGSWQRNMQDFDLLEQHLGDLAHCLQAASVEPAVQRAADMSEPRVLGPLRLDDLRQRLRGRAGWPEPGETVEVF